jgi:hypothetical protein
MVKKLPGSYSFQKIVLQMALMFSALRAGHSLFSRKIPGTHFCLGLSRTQGYGAARGIK